MGQNRYDVPHSLHAARKIREMQPDIVLLELPEKPFQLIIDQYLKGKLTEKKFIYKISKIMGRELNIDYTLLEKFDKGKITLEELELIEPDASFVHIVVQAKKNKTKVLCIDIPLSEIEKDVRDLMKFKDEQEIEAINEAREVMMGIKPVALMRWAYEPFHVLEIILGHHPESDPFKHNVECPICKAGVAWERFVHNIGASLVSVLPVKKTLVALRHYDLVREKKMANKIFKVHSDMKKKLKKDPHVFAILHVWHESAVEKLVAKRGIKVVEVD